MDIDIITYRNTDGNLPSYLDRCIEDKILKGFNVLPITPDSYNDEKPYHAGYLHFKNITMPKLKASKEGIFICEGDVLLKDGITIDDCPKTSKPIWLGYKKKLSNYIVGNFLLWLPRSSYDMLEEQLNKKKRIYSDRFWSNLYFKGLIDLYPVSLADEITHYSNVAKGIRKGVD
tara:strand:+ start:489 stop:1010 length:522 start_codon:yes stop_codon:yes gene_type:complete